jgi:peptidylprolyl isomerase
VVTPWLDGKRVVFGEVGEVVEGADIVNAIEALGSSSGATAKKIVIEESGLVPTV